MKARRIATFAVGPIGTAVLGLITLPIVTWFYSIEDIGRIAMLQVVTSFCILLFSLGLDQAYVREYHETESKPALLKASLLPGLLLVILVLVFCLVDPGLISRELFSIESTLISVLVASCILAAFISRFLSLILRMQERGMAFSMSQLLPKVLFLSVIGAYFLLAFDFDLLHLVVAHTISIVAVVLVYGWNTRSEWLLALRQEIDKDKFIALLRFGYPLILGGLAFWGMTTMDKLFLRHYSTFEELGVFSVAASFAAVAIILQSVFSTVWAPIVYKWVAEGVDEEKLNEVTEYVLAAVVALFALAGLFSWIITFILPEKYNEVQYILVACMAYPLFYTLSETTVVGIGVTRKSAYSMAASVIAVLVSVVGNYFLVPIYGAAGAAVSTALAFWFFFFLRTEFSCIVWRKVPRLRLYSLTLVCLVLAIGFTLKGKDFPVLFIVGWLSVLLGGLVAFRKTIACFIKANLVRVRSL